MLPCAGRFLCYFPAPFSGSTLHAHREARRDQSEVARPPRGRALPQEGPARREGPPEAPQVAARRGREGRQGRDRVRSVRRARTLALERRMARIALASLCALAFA